MKLTTDMTIDREKARDTGMAVTLLLIILELWLGGGLYLKIAAACLLIAMVYPPLFRPVGYLWFGLGHMLGYVASRIMLTVVFLLLVVPVAYIRRMTGKDTLKLKQWKRGDASVLETRDHIYSQADLDKPY